eukprot:7248608-Heterocapsa_arctica.AAC.1
MGIGKNTSLERASEAQNWSQAQFLCKIISVLRGIEWRQRGRPRTARQPSNTIKDVRSHAH